MIKVPISVINRIAKEIPKYKRILEKAKTRDVNESDTVIIITDILSSVFGFDKFNEITSEHSIKGTYCDLATKLDGEIKYLVEVKAIGISLKENHLSQAVNYGSNSGIQWVILTNGIMWEVHRINFERPITHELVCSFDFSMLSAKNHDDQIKLFLLCKEGASTSAIDKYDYHITQVNKYTIGAISLTEPITNLIRKELRRISPGLRVTTEEIHGILESEVIKREVIEGDSFIIACKRIKKSSKKTEPKPIIINKEQNKPSSSETPSMLA
jgi:cellobiose-specific phosphotransferase system component IIB